MALGLGVVSFGYGVTQIAEGIDDLIAILNKDNSGNNDNEHLKKITEAGDAIKKQKELLEEQRKKIEEQKKKLPDEHHNKLDKILADIDKQLKTLDDVQKKLHDITSKEPVKPDDKPSPIKQPVKELVKDDDADTDYAPSHDHAILPDTSNAHDLAATDGFLFLS